MKSYSRGPVSEGPFREFGAQMIWIGKVALAAAVTAGLISRLLPGVRGLVRALNVFHSLQSAEQFRKVRLSIAERQDGLGTRIERIFHTGVTGLAIEVKDQHLLGLMRGQNRHA